MNQSGVVLLLEGPLQAWGTQSRFGQRDTDLEPSKSGVLGLVGSALGMGRDDQATLAELARLEMGVRVDHEGRLLRDYHTIGGGTFRGAPHGVFGTNDTVVTTRYYLMDACFVVALAGYDDALIERIVGALQSPHWPLFLGRRSCTPSRPVFLAGPKAGDVRALLREVPWQYRRGPKPARLRCVLEDPSGRPRSDHPKNFSRHARAFENRFVGEEWIELAELKGEVDVPVPPAAESSLS